MKLIDADELIKSFDTLCANGCRYSRKQGVVMCGACLLGIAFDEIDSAPTIDAVPVVRCVDCKHYLDEDQKGCDLTYSIIKPSDYCSYGERRSDAAGI